MCIIRGLNEGSRPLFTKKTGEFPAQMASCAENVSIWWRHHVMCGDRINLFPSKWQWQHLAIEPGHMILSYMVTKQYNSAKIAALCVLVYSLILTIGWCYKVVKYNTSQNTKYSYQVDHRPESKLTHHIKQSFMNYAVSVASILDNADRVITQKHKGSRRLNKRCSNSAGNIYNHIQPYPTQYGKYRPIC